MRLPAQFISCSCPQLMPPTEVAAAAFSKKSRRRHSSASDGTAVQRKMQHQIKELQRQLHALRVYVRRLGSHIDTAPKRAAPKTIFETAEYKLKQLVSKKKRRLQEDSFDLDLTYITGNVISMGYPATGMEGIYRNKITDVKKFLDQRHRGHYRLYNLCSERIYDHSLFEGRVNHDFRFIDHHPPPMKHFAPFVASVTKWLVASRKVPL